MLSFGDNIGKESKTTEYKVFAFNPLKISQDDAIEYLSTGIFSFNESVIETIKNYIDIYLPKYICSFMNPISNIDEGYLYFGICDNGDVSGIPYNGNMSVIFINSQINKVFNKLLKFNNVEEKEEIKNCISFTIINVNKENLKKTKNNIYNNYLKEIKKINDNNILYEKKKNIWKKMFNTTAVKLNDMINNEETRSIIWEFIKEKTNYSKKLFKNKYSHLEKYCDVYDYWNLLYEIKSKKQFEKLKTHEILYAKNDKLNIYSWIILWKDSKNNLLKKAKPKISKKNIDKNYPIFLLSQSTKMIPLWVNKNKNLNLQIIKITINVKKKMCIQYKHIDGTWKKCYRTEQCNKQPMSVSSSP